MAVIHRTTMQPTKMELLGAWLPTRPWYAAGAGGPLPVRAGGFRLDDPEGEVGIEFMVVTDGTGPDAVAHHVPLTYRAHPLPGAEHALVGTSEHGVLGRRWVYDGAHDPVLVERLYALLDGRAEPQDQTATDAPDPTVAVVPLAPDGTGADVELVRVEEGPDHTDVVVRRPGAPAPLVLRVRRVLRADGDGGTADGGTARVTGEWQRPDGTTARGTYATAFTELAASTDFTA
ncbi:maltokinase N-terminal cap-like domain-containing protein [Streptomyces cinereoruber]|uniref:maltokinase N-terminal cap-like domain-containing protein n=1 Tax=Streptomyces cinereoruber TaxID=67260 RepID=UPI003BF5030C